MRSIAISLAALAFVATAHAQEPPRWSVYIPRLGLVRPIGECPIVDRIHDTSALEQGVCHLEGTATLDYDWARIVLAGHSNGAFAELHDLRAGDSVIVWDAHTVEVYTVTDLHTVAVADTRWLMPTREETLTLITCAGDDRLIVNVRKN